MQDVVVGQERVVRALASSVKSDRLAHGLLFAGPPGPGPAPGPSKGPSAGATSTTTLSTA
jgi:hypothetical protein